MYTQNINRTPQSNEKSIPGNSRNFKKSTTLDTNRDFRRMKTNPLMKHVSRSPKPVARSANNMESQISPLLNYQVNTQGPRAFQGLKSHSKSPQKRKRDVFKAEVPDYPKPKDTTPLTAQEELYFVNEEYSQLPDSLVRLLKLKIIKQDTIKAYNKRISKLKTLLGSNGIVSRANALQTQKNNLENHFQIAKHTLNDEIMLREDQKLAHQEIGNGFCSINTTKRIGADE